MKLKAHFTQEENGDISWDIKFEKDTDNGKVINVLKNFLDGLISLENENNNPDLDYSLTNLTKGIIFQKHHAAGILYAGHDAHFSFWELP